MRTMRMENERMMIVVKCKEGPTLSFLKSMAAVMADTYVAHTHKHTTHT